ncbi:MAG TPA: polysaccharide biosynthesis/export family protein [Vitreimonas sp.]|uniref:polysaccharide biosynthesis/export family protein n=1 Tax=Vitreimonas sp. TaxID=3069702 RepID=UPI002D72F3F2|nr:polysaccharide biosynthesis/export family protein [Vitreimonas sp.]HYD88949.1 polysaccharide biosynthesis/export family protein [Vitreimonas sp.]
MPKPIWHTRRTLLLGVSLSAGAGLLGGCATMPSTPADVSQPTEYRLGPGDQLRITVFNEAELTGQFVVGSQGTISYPLVGTVEAAGLTVSEFSEQLQQALSEYIRQPNVSVEVANYRPFFILGEVQRPGTYPYSANLTVLNAVATAGGFTYRANRNRVFIRHANEPDERAYPLTIATPVMPGDTIRIGERLF